jgi:GNAT superfamily N-acetyltransferase
MKINRVDIRSSKTQKELSELQRICLPNDIPYDTTIGYWWKVTDSLNGDIGFAGLVYSSRWSDCGYLCRAGVVPGSRGQGIQKKLIRVRIRQAKAIGMNWLVTDTYHNPASSNSLISCGFKLFDPSVPWGAKSTLYWRLKLE